MKSPSSLVDMTSFRLPISRYLILKLLAIPSRHPSQDSKEYSPLHHEFVLSQETTTDSSLSMLLADVVVPDNE